MAGPYTSVVEINHIDDIFPSVASKNETVFGMRLWQFIRAIVAGTYRGTGFVYRGHAAKASGTATVASGAGTETITINGVAITATWTTSDANTASLLAAAVNASANALVAGVVTATSALGVVTITAVQPGSTGNAITLAASGTGMTPSGARLTGGTMDTGITYATT